MKRIIGTAALMLVLTAPAAGAQAAKPAPADHGSHQAHGKPKLDAEMAEHFKGITLTDEQVQKLTELKEKHHKAMDALKKEAKDPADPTLKASLQKHMDAEHAEFKALLTPEQVKVFEENMKSHHKAEGKHEMKEGHDAKHDTKPDAKAAAKPAERKPR
jgi:Spy/CpxP family protein refolding chaperone